MTETKSERSICAEIFNGGVKFSREILNRIKISSNLSLLVMDEISMLKVSSTRNIMYFYLSS